MLIALVCLLCLLLFPRTEASAGDRSTVYQNCLKQCIAQNCSSKDAIANFTRRQSWYLRLFCWDCLSECEHDCMWHTVNVATLRGYAVPQFHGKVNLQIEHFLAEFWKQTCIVEAKFIFYSTITSGPLSGFGVSKNLLP